MSFLKRLFTPAKKFNEALNTTVYTTTHVMKDGSPILLVYHELDGSWQFMGGQLIDDYRQVAMLVSLGQVINMDKSVLKVADLPLGWYATRKSRNVPWTVAPINYSDEEIKEMGYYCSECGQYHKDMPMAYDVYAPNHYLSIPEEEWTERCLLTKDQCIIDDIHYFIKGRFELQVDQSEKKFFWAVWVKVSEHDFERINEMWEDENRILEAPYQGIIDTHLEPYPETLGLPVRVITQRVGHKPKIELLESDHPLHFEQECGINMHRVAEFAKQLT